MIKANFNSYWNNVQISGGQPTLSACPTTISTSTSHTRPMRLRCALRRLATVAALLLTSVLGAKAADYVLTYTTGNTTYYLARNGTSGVQRVDTFDPTTCIWSCENSGGTASTLSNSTTYGWLYQTVNGTKYYLKNGGSIGLSTTKNTATTGNSSSNPQTWRTNGTYLYNWYQTGRWNTYTLYINLSSSTIDYETSASNSCARPYQVTPDTHNASTTVTVPTISPATVELDYNDSQEFLASASATTTPSYTTYEFNNNTIYYFNNTAYTSEANMKASSAWTTAAAAPTITYSWTLSGSANSNLSPTSGTGSTITITHSTQASNDVSSTLSVTASANANGDSDSKTSTSNATVTALAPKTDPTSLTISSGSPMTVYVGSTGNITYTLTPSPCYNNVTFTSSSTSVATVSNSGVVTGVSAGTATITVTAKKIDGTTNASLTKTVTVTVKDKVATPVITFTPDANDNTKATATISCGTTGTTIYYTVDGTAPTSSSTQYNGTFQVDEYDQVKAIAIKTTDGTYWDDSDVATGTYVSCTTDAPQISYVQSGTTANVTITAEAGATIYYTTNGNNPTTSSANGISPLTINNVGNCTFKAIAKNGTCRESDVVTKEIITSGVSGGTVTLYDLEDHNWTYYSDKPDSDYPDNLRSPDPRNVIITYRGGSVSGASDVAVSATESQNEFVYYKTIEKKAWGNSEGRWLTGDYAYKVIPNPFSKRPRTTGSTGTNGFYGFAGWKIISGGEYINGHNDNDVLDLEEKINFVNLPAGNDGNGAVVFEATWTAANVVTVNGNVTGAAGLAGTGGTYETNFIVVSGNDRTVTGMTRNATVMGCYPDGSEATGARLSTVTGSGNDLKIENINIGGGSNDYTANTGWLIVGRGCTGNVRRVIGNTGQVKIRIESGIYNFINPMSQNTESNSNYGYIIFGCDYDRATNDGLTSNDQYADNSTHRKLRVINYVSLNGNYADKASDDDRSEYMDITIKSGFFGFSADFSKFNSTLNANGQDGVGLGIGGNTDNLKTTYSTYDQDNNPITYNVSDWNVANSTDFRWQKLLSFYCGRTRGGHYGGINRVLVEGGELSSINGGGYRNTGANFDVCYHFRMKGGWVKGAIYGTASSSQTNATTKQVITGGEINGWIAGACNGTDVDNAAGENLGDTYIYLGGNAELRSHRKDGVYNNAWGLVGGVEGGSIFASGRGTPATNAQPNRNYCGSSYKTYAVVADQAQVEKNVCGGGYIGVAQNSHIYITGGEIGNVYGGSMTPTSTNNTWMTQTTDIRQYGGTVKGGIYGGHYQGTGNAGKIHQDVKVNIVNGQVGTDVDHLANIHGGGFGSGTSVGGNVDVTIGDATATESLVIYGDVYGGSALGTVNTSSSNHTYVTLNKGIINGSLYGGGLGDGNTAANVNGPVIVTVNGGTVNTTTANGSGAVYGCNNIKGAPQNTVTVIINGTDPTPNANTYALDAVYGGGNQADYSYGTPTVTVNNCDNSIAYVYGGGNAASVPGTDVQIYGGNKIGNVFAGGNGTNGAANVTGNTRARIYGGTIGKVFGGSNSAGTIGGTISVEINKTGSCTMHIDEVYGGGNMAASNAGNISIGCTGGADEGIGDVYGGANAADITGNIALDIAGGSIQRLFGGNNASGNISGSITVNVDWDTDNPCGYNYLGTVYGGGNQAAYSPTTVGSYPAVNIKNGTVSGSVFGGGLGSTAVVTSNPVVLMTGGQAANVYGGGMQAGVTGNTNVSIEGGIVTTDVYGGGMQADVSGNVTVNISKSGTPGTVEIGRDVYGGGALANTNTGNIDSETTMTTNRYVTVVNLYPGATIGHDVYGGGRGQKASGANPAIEAIVYGNDSVYQYGAVLTATYNSEGLATGGRIFGGNNENGTPKGHILVYVNKTAGTATQQRSSADARADADTTHTYELAAVYGGGNEAEYNPYSDTDFAEVQIDGCNDVSIHSVYGGGNAASTPATKVTIGGAYEIEYVFGGGNGAGTGNPGANVGYHAYPKNVSGTDQIADRAGYRYGSGVATTNIYGGRIHHIYGGSNTRGNVRETAVAMLDEVNDCPLVVDGIYGGGREAYMEGNANLELGCITGMGELYGGSEKADVGNSVELTITSGHFGKVFGGNNKGGRIYGSIKVNIEQTGCIPITIDELYLGGNNAPYSVYGYTDSAYQVVIDGESVTHYQLNESGTTKYPDPELNIRSFESIGTVYGGGKGEPATMVGNPIVDINVTQGWVNGMYVGNVPAYIQYKQKPAILSTDGVIGTVFGGGNAADVIGNTEIRVGDKMGSNVDLKSMQSLIGTLSDEYDIKSGIKMQKESGNSIKFTAVDADGNAISGTDPLTVGVSQKVNGAVIQDNIYGGGNQAVVTGGTNTVVGPAK